MKCQIENERGHNLSRQVSLKIISFYIITFFLVIGLIELGAFITSFYIYPDYYYQPATIKQYENYVVAAKATQRPLGWGRIDERRPSPAGQGLANPLASLYGDSFTYGWDVSEDEAWGNLLTKMLHQRVDNYGMPAFGTDQAYLKFCGNKNDAAKIVLLCHLSENICRNINQFRDLIYDDVQRPYILLKPRFTTDGQGYLTLIPTPELTMADYPDFVQHPGKYLAHEFFLPDHGPLTKKTLGFPYLVRVPYAFTYKRAYMRILLRRWQNWFPPPWYAELYDPGHPSQALPLTRDIMLNFVQEAQDRGKTPLLFVIPTMQDIDYFRTSGHWIYAPLLEGLKARGVQAYNLGPRLLAKVPAGEDLRDYFATNKKPRDGHYTAAGNRLLAEVARDILKENGLVP